MKKAAQALPNQRLIDERLRHHWTQQEVADRIETTRINVNRWERGVTSPGPYFCQQLCTLFDKSAGELGLQENDEAIFQRDLDGDRAQPVSPAPGEEQLSHLPPLPPSPGAPRSTQSQMDRRRVLIGLAGGATALVAARCASLFFLNPSLSVNYNVPGTTLCVYRQHHLMVRCVAWSPGRKYLVSAGSDTVVYVWTPDSDSGHTISLYTGHRHEVYAVAWSPDGQYIASGSQDNTVQVWHTATRERIFTYSGHIDWVLSVSWSPLHQRIVSGCSDGTVQVWDAFSGNHAYKYRHHLFAVHAVAWSPDGTRIASGGSDRTVRVWRS